MPSHRGNDHACLSDAPHSIPPLDGEGVARRRATGGMREVDAGVMTTARPGLIRGPGTRPPSRRKRSFPCSTSNGSAKTRTPSSKA